MVAPNIGIAFFQLWRKDDVGNAIAKRPKIISSNQHANIQPYCSYIKIFLHRQIRNRNFFKTRQRRGRDAAGRQ
jgi:hypothetical protein